jgi:CTP synthase
VQRLQIANATEPDLTNWRRLVSRIVDPSARVRIAVVGKYTALVDSYKSVHEALIHGGIANDVGVDIDWLLSDLFTSAERAGEILQDYDGLLVPGGFGVRGVEGMVEAIRWTRENGMPFFGICLGMQAAVIEFARNKLQLDDSHSSEFAPECEHPVISLMESQQHVTDMGGTMRLGAYPCRLRPGSLAADMYGVPEISERHRHRYEFANAYREQFTSHGMRLSGISPDGALVEIMELPAHAWYVGCQFHPELRSRPTRPHPLFAGFVGASLKVRLAREAAPAPLEGTPAHAGG